MTAVVRHLARVSTGRQAEEGHSLDQQEHRAQGYAERENKALVTYREEGVSGASKRRPKRDRLLADLQPGDTVLVTSLDRLGRSTRDLLETFDLIEAKGATLVSLREAIDTSTAAGRLLRTILAAVAEFERELGRERTSAGIAGRARATAKPWGAVSYGLRRREDGHAEWHPHERPTLERIFSMREAGQSKSEIARKLTQEDVPTRSGARMWSPTVVTKILRGREPLGEIYVGGEWRKGEHEPFMTEARWNIVQALDEQSRAYAPGGRSGRTSNSHLFGRGLLRCACGAAMLPRSAKDSADFYVCHRRGRDASSCSTPRLKAGKVDAAAFEMFTNVSHDIDATRQHVVNQLSLRAGEARALADRAEREIADLTEQAERVERDYRRGALDAESYGRLSVAIRGEREATEAKAAQLILRAADVEAALANVDAEDETLRRLAALRDGIAERMANATDLSALRAAMTAVFERVVLVPGDNGMFWLKPLFRRDAASTLSGVGFEVSEMSTESGVAL
jgi:DNA invertase Pin-like site-specific DNA recombinase